MTDRLTLPAFFDAHVHLRQPDDFPALAPHTARCCDACVLMPNVEPPLDRPERWLAYRRAAAAALAPCVPLVAFKVAAVQAVNLHWLDELKAAGCLVGKLYPEGVTTNSEGGPSRDDLRRVGECGTWLRAVLERMQDLDLVLSVHPELPGAFCLDREATFLHVAADVLRHLPRLKVVLEHVSTRESVEFVADRDDGRLACTVTAHHMALTLDDVVGDKLAVHNFCKPVAKRPRDRDAVRALALSGDPRCFLGSDSAPHVRGRKECATGCAGVFSAPVLAEALAETFDAHGALGKLAAFASLNGRAFYGLPTASRQVSLARRPHRVAWCGAFVPWRDGETLAWSLEGCA